MRTTIRLQDRLFRDVKRLAAESGRVFTALVEQSLRKTFARVERKPKRKVRLKTSKGVFARGVDPDRSAALRDLMDAGAARSHPSTV